MALPGWTTRGDNHLDESGLGKSHEQSAFPSTHTTERFKFQGDTRHGVKCDGTGATTDSLSSIRKTGSRLSQRQRLTLFTAPLLGVQFRSWAKKSCYLWKSNKLCIKCLEMEKKVYIALFKTVQCKYHFWSRKISFPDSLEPGKLWKGRVFLLSASYPILLGLKNRSLSFETAVGRTGHLAFNLREF